MVQKAVIRKLKTDLYMVISWKSEIWIRIWLRVLLINVAPWQIIFNISYELFDDVIPVDAVIDPDHVHAFNEQHGDERNVELEALLDEKSYWDEPTNEE